MSIPFNSIIFPEFTTFLMSISSYTLSSQRLSQYLPILLRFGILWEKERFYFQRTVIFFRDFAKNVQFENDSRFCPSICELGIIMLPCDLIFF